MRQYELKNNSKKFTAWQESVRFRFELQGDSREEADAIVCVNDNNRKVPFLIQSAIKITYITSFRVINQDLGFRTAV